MELSDVVHLALAYGDSDAPRLAELAARQHGVVSLWQLGSLGYGANAVARLVAKGHLHRVYLGVYAVGHTRLTLRGRWMAAVLACGPNAVLSHRSAAGLWELRPAASGRIDVTVPGRGRGGPRSVRAHRTRGFDPADLTIFDGIPVTTIERTALDYAEAASAQLMRRALETAERRELIDGRKLHALIARSPGRHGLKPLTNALGAMASSDNAAPWTQPGLEDEFLMLIRRANLPDPRCNVVVEGYVVDFYWDEQRVVAEIDSFEFHKSREAFERDRREDTTLRLARIDVIRPTQRRIEHEPNALGDDLRRMLRAPASGPDR